YMPLGKLEKGREKTTLVFDTWANVGDGELIIHWDCTLDEDALALFQQIVSHLGYLGRSESWVEAEPVAAAENSQADFNAYPHTEGHNPGPGWEQVSLMAATFPESYANWRAEMAEKALAEYPLPEGKKKPGKKLLKDREKATAPYPEDLLEALQKDTVWWKGHRWSQPPGSRRVIYWRKSDALQVSPPIRLPRPKVKPVSAMLLAITTPSGNTSALPHVSRTLPQAELLHAALIGRAANGQTIDCPELTGLNERGNPLQEGHRHAHILPLDLDRDQHLDHILIYAPMGLGGEAQRAVRTLRRTWTKGGVGELQLALAGCGELEDLRRIRGPLLHRVDSLLASCDGSTVWNSETPFVPPRHLKKEGKNTLTGQINAELASRGMQPAATITIQSPRISEQARQFRHFVRVRQRGGNAPPTAIGLAVRLEFCEPIIGPVILGYGCHFGLGMFAAEGQ
ncbi:MAG: type I-U CRISPR-associated protein Csb2, partial [bacterium]